MKPGTILCNCLNLYIMFMRYLNIYFKTAASLRTIHMLLMWRACNLTAFIHSSSGPVVHPFVSHHEGPGFNPYGGTFVKPGFSC